MGTQKDSRSSRSKIPFSSVQALAESSLIRTRSTRCPYCWSIWAADWRISWRSSSWGGGGDLNWMKCCRLIGWVESLRTVFYFRKKRGMMNLTATRRFLKPGLGLQTTLYLRTKWSLKPHRQAAMLSSSSSSRWGGCAAAPSALRDARFDEDDVRLELCSSEPLQGLKTDLGPEGEEDKTRRDARHELTSGCTSTTHILFLACTERIASILVPYWFSLYSPCSINLRRRRELNLLTAKQKLK